MRYLLYSLFIFSLIGVINCGPSGAPVEPTPDLQAKLKAETEMNRWFTQVRYVFFLGQEARQLIEKRIELTNKTQNRSALNQLFEYYNGPGNLNERINEALTDLKRIETSLAKYQEIDQTKYKNLTDLTKTFSKYHRTLLAFPDNPLDYLAKLDSYSDNFRSIEGILINDFPNSDNELSSMKSRKSLLFGVI